MDTRKPCAAAVHLAVPERSDKASEPRRLVFLARPRAGGNLGELQIEHAAEVHPIRGPELKEVHPAVPDDLADVGAREQAHDFGHRRRLPVERDGVKDEDMFRVRGADGKQRQCTPELSEFTTLAIEDQELGTREDGKRILDGLLGGAEGVHDVHGEIWSWMWWERAR